MLILLALIKLVKNKADGMIINHRAMRCLPELPDFQLSLRPEEFELPEIEAGSSEGNQTHLLSEHLEDYSDNHDDEDDDDELDH